MEFIQLLSLAVTAIILFILVPSMLDKHPKITKKHI